MSSQSENCPGSPKEVLLFRHGFSDYLAAKAAKRAVPYYQELLAGIKQDPLPSNIQELAQRAAEEFPRTYDTDDDTPLAPGAVEQLKEYGEVLRNRYLQGELKLPSVIFVSPTKRTRDTFLAYISGFPELAEKIQAGEINVIEDIRIREKLYGEVTQYSDRNVYFGLHPEVIEESRRLGRRASFEQRYAGGGQNIPDKMAEMSEWDKYIATEYDGQVVWAFTHHLAILSYRLVEEGYNGNEGDTVADRFRELDHNETPPPGSVTTYERECIDDPILGRRGKLVLKKANEIPV